VTHYKGSNKPLPQIARELNVDGIIEGSALRSGNRVRITAQLILASSDAHLWGKSYERDLRDVLALQGEVAQAIAKEIKTNLTPHEHARLARARPVNPEAYELYLRGRYEWNKRTRESLYKALDYFRRAINLDPTYALAYSGLADVYLILGDNGFLPGADVFPKSKAAALKALELDENSAEAHVSLAGVLSSEGRDRMAALREYETAIQLSPNYAAAHHWYAVELAYIGRSEVAIPEIEQARSLDPLSVRINANVPYVYYLARQYDQAVAEAHKALELEPRDVVTHRFLGWTYLQKRMPKEALAEFEMELTLEPGSPQALADLALGYAVAGNIKEAEKILAGLQQRSRKEYVTPYFMAKAYVGLGQKEQAVACLKKGFEVQDALMDLLKVDPALDSLRSDPRFQDLLRRMNFPE
jgi:tetratricopeptide (TPR) repeat protein